jgi:hypothetical protein
MAVRCGARVIQMTLGLSPNFSTAVEKAVENQSFMRFHINSSIKLFDFCEILTSPAFESARKLAV